MDDTITITEVYITGTKEIIIRALNNVFSKIKPDFFATDDSLSDINKKINDMRGPAVFDLLDFLDKKNVEACPFKEKLSKNWADCDDGGRFEDYEINIGEAKAAGNQITISAGCHYNSEYQESYSWEDWTDWCMRMARLYGTRVVLHQEAFNSWCDRNFNVDCVYDGYCAKIYEPVDDDVRVVEPWPYTHWNEDYLDELGEILQLEPSQKIEHMLCDYSRIKNELEGKIKKLRHELEKLNQGEELVEGLNAQEEKKATDEGPWDLPY